MNIGQILFLGICGTELTPSEKKLIELIHPGGFVLFSRNMETPAQVRALTDSLREASAIRPIIAIDEEGGRVSRTRHLGHEPPSAQELADAKDDRLILWHGQRTAEVLSLLGIDMDFAPVLDISYDREADNALQGRCYGENAMEVLTHGAIFNAGLRSKGIFSCGKHFPSCGVGQCDPHHDLPIVRKSLEKLKEEDVRVYEGLFYQLDAIMGCHTLFEGLDVHPASLSPFFLRKILRQQMGYEGLVLTDDLDMGAIGSRYPRGEDLAQAIIAGNDMALICHRTETAQGALGYVEKELGVSFLQDSLARIAALKERFQVIDHFSQTRWEELNEQGLALRIATLGEEEALLPRDYSGEKRSPVEIY